MAEKNPSDLIMKFVKGKSAIPGETRTDLSGMTEEGLAKGFKTGFMFEVASFTFKCGISGDESEGGAAKKKEVKYGKDNKPLKPSSAGEFKKWRSGERTQPYPVDMQPVEFTRAIDKASVGMLDDCVKRVNYDSATLIKRKAAGGKAAGEVFLRFDFTGVLITSLEWANDEPILETCEFITRAVTVFYRPQLPDGSLGGTIQGFWSMVPDMSPATIA